MSALLADESSLAGRSERAFMAATWDRRHLTHGVYPATLGIHRTFRGSGSGPGRWPSRLTLAVKPHPLAAAAP